MTTSAGNKKSGFVLIAVLMTTSILIIMTIPYVARVMSEYKLMMKTYSATAALDLAEAGIDRALWEISYNSSAFTGWSSSMDGSGNQVKSISVNNFGTAAGQKIGDYDAIVSLSADGIAASVTGKGYVPDRAHPDQVKVVKIAYSRRNFSMTIRTSGNGPGAITLGIQDRVDSYNSANGTYAQTHSNSNGSISTNGSIVFNTQAKVYGDAHPGPSYPFSSKPSNVTGAWGTLQAPVTLDPIPQTVFNAAAAAQSANNNSNIVKGNQSDPSPLAGYALNLGTQKTATLPGGTYYFSALNMGIQSRLNVTGQSTIYVDAGNVSVGTQANLNLTANAPVTLYVLGGNLTISTQGAINNPGVPKNLMLYSSGQVINFSTQTDFYGAIYAPNAAVSLTTQGDIFGSLACKTFTGGTQAGVHFDMDLLNVTPVFVSNTASSWRESDQ